MDVGDLPPAVLKTPSLNVEIGVTHYKPPGAAWAQLVIIIFYAVRAYRRGVSRA